jgi:biopolymer transport protein ExbB
MWNSLEPLLKQAQQIWSEAILIWNDGGWAMYPIAGTGVVMFGLGLHVWFTLIGKGHERLAEREWRRWINRPRERRGPVGGLIDAIDGAETLEETAKFFGQVRSAEVAPLDRDLLVMKICVGAAPLFGLLGTVTGMLTTFDALGSGSGGEKTMGMIASGISEALITTEAGLVMALPGLLLHYLFSRKNERYKAFLAHLENVCVQAHHLRIERGLAVA